MADNNHPLLEKGSFGEDVSRLQELLVAHGYPLSVDGEFGPGTSRSLKEFQSASGILPSGVTFPDTWYALAGNPSPKEVVSGSVESDAISRVLAECGCAQEDVSRWSNPLAEAIAKYSIVGRENLSGFLGTLVHESNKFHGSLVESLNYSAEALMKNWPRRFPPHLASRFGRTADHPADQKLIAVLAYGGRMGNAPHPSMDGWDFRGRGPIQITGKDNYRDFEKSSGFKVLEDPELILKPEVGASSSAWYWTSRKCFVPASSGDWRGLRKIVNGGDFGLDECIKYTKIALRVF